MVCDRLWLGVLWGQASKGLECFAWKARFWISLKEWTISNSFLSNEMLQTFPCCRDFVVCSFCIPFLQVSSLKKITERFKNLSSEFVFFYCTLWKKSLDYFSLRYVHIYIYSFLFFIIKGRSSFPFNYNNKNLPQTS